MDLGTKGYSDLSEKPWLIITFNLKRFVEMAKNFFVTDFRTGGNYVICPKTTMETKIKSTCHECEHFKGGGRLRITKEIYGNHYIHCKLLMQDSNYQMELKAE